MKYPFRFYTYLIISLDTNLVLTINRFIVEIQVNQSHNYQMIERFQHDLILLK